MRTRTKILAGGVAAVLVGGIGEAGWQIALHGHSWGEAVVNDTNAGLRNHHSGSIWLNTHNLEPKTVAGLGKAVTDLATDLGGSSPYYTALAECAIASANDGVHFDSSEQAPVRRHIQAIAAEFSFGDPAAPLPKGLQADCHAINVQLVNGTHTVQVPGKR